MVAILLFRGLKPGAFLNASTCFIFCSVGNGFFFPLLISFENGKELQSVKNAKRKKRKISYQILFNCCFEIFLYSESANEVVMLNMEKKNLLCQGVLKLSAIWAQSFIRLNIARNCVCSHGCMFYRNVAAEQSCWMTFRLNSICIKAYD